jgi:acetylornithine deacetylase/succinyl-diaminopimelate desuccinylase-like protein
MSKQAVLDSLDANRQANFDRLLEFLRFETISAQSQHRGDMQACADWLVRLFTTAGVLARAGNDDARTTVLVYGHYDVQPVGDEKLWQSPPFEPTIRDGRIVARGAADDKGQIFTHVVATLAWINAARTLPVRVIFLIEGEEEIGSPNLGTFVQRHADELACDYVVLSDTAKLDADTPALTVSTRGLLYKQLTIAGPSKDLHSGLYGGAVGNPLNTLAKILASLVDKKGRVTIPGFYDNVQTPDVHQREALARIAPNDDNMANALGCPALAGEEGYTTIERIGVRPSLDVNGIIGGYTGEGSSTIIPARASAKVSMRLVEGQQPDAISQAFDKAVAAACPPSVRLSIETSAACEAYATRADTPGAQAALAAMAAAYDAQPALLYEGATLPILPLFRRVLRADSLMMGYCMRDCNAHSPNEFFHVSDFEAGCRASALFLAELADRVR